MICYRPFLNGDIPAIVEIWKNHGPDPALAKEISAELFDRLVLSKLYFDRQGLIMALAGETVIGFVHAGFGPNADESQIDTACGVISLLLMHAEHADPQITDSLLEQAEEYLTARGARTIVGIGAGEICPFYLGLYGGCDLPGVFESDVDRARFFEQHGYQPNSRILCYRRAIIGFRPTPNRLTVHLRRALKVEFATDPAARSWWDACTQGCLPQLSAVARSLSENEICAKAIFCDMQTLTGPAPQRSMGLSRLEVSEGVAPRGAGEYLLEDCFCYLQQQGIEQVLGQCAEDDISRGQLFKNIGMEHYDTGTLWSKDIG